MSTPTASATTGIARIIDQACALIPDCPQPGVLFRDLTPLFADGAALRAVTDEFASRWAGRFDLIAGVEARGFLLAAAVAYAAGTGVLPVRKQGKLPRETYAQEYSLEYGTATLEVHREDAPAGARVLILDDVLATGGTLSATVQLMRRAELEVAGIGVVLELEGLGGRDALAGIPLDPLRTV